MFSITPFSFPSLAVLLARRNEVTVSTCMDIWKEEYLSACRLSLGTISNYESVIRVLNSFEITRKNVRKVTTEDLQILMDELCLIYPNSRINAFSAVLNHVFDYAVNVLRIIRHNPMNGVEICKCRGEDILFSHNVDENRRNTLTKEQYLQIVKLLREKENPALLPILIAYHTGLRLGEVCGLSWQDVFLEEKYLIVRRSVMMNRSSHNRMEFVPPKREKMRRVEFGNTLKQILHSAKEEQEKNQEKYGERYFRNYVHTVNEEGRTHYVLLYKRKCEEIEKTFREIPLVCVRDNGAYESRRTISSACFRLRKEPGLEQFHFHQLRHTYATNLLWAGAQPKEIQQQLGHEDISTTMNIYAHADRKRLHQVIERMEKRNT